MASQAIATDAFPLPPLNADLLDRITRTLAETAEDYDRSAQFPRANFDLLVKAVESIGAEVIA